VHVLVLVLDVGVGERKHRIAIDLGALAEAPGSCGSLADAATQEGFRWSRVPAIS